MLIVILLVLSGCSIRKSRVEQSVKDFLKSQFNLNNGYKVLAAKEKVLSENNKYAF